MKRTDLVSDALRQRREAHRSWADHATAAALGLAFGFGVIAVAALATFLLS